MDAILKKTIFQDGAAQGAKETLEWVFDILERYRDNFNSEDDYREVLAEIKELE